MYKYIKQLFTLAGIVSLLFVFACDNMGGDQSKGKSKTLKNTQNLKNYDPSTPLNPFTLKLQ